MSLALLETPWRLLAACRGKGPEIFFPTDWQGVERARDICRDCPVRFECLEEALSMTYQYGVWGGESERSRRRMRETRRSW